MHAYLHLEPPALLYMHARLVIHVTLFYWDLLPMERSPYLLQRVFFTIRCSNAKCSHSISLVHVKSYT